MFWHYIAILRERCYCLLRDAQLFDAPRHETQNDHPPKSIDCSTINTSQKALGTLPEDGNVMPKHVGATIHN
jgi:hypothetical protein